MSRRDYSLLGEDGRRAVETGLAAAEWYHTDVPRKDMKALMQRSDQPAIRDTIIYYGAMIVFAGHRHLALAVLVVGTRSGSPMACSTARAAIRAGTNAATARRSARPG